MKKLKMDVNDKFNNENKKDKYIDTENSQNKSGVNEDTIIFKPITQKDIEREKRLQAIKKENNKFQEVKRVPSTTQNKEVKKFSEKEVAKIVPGKSMSKVEGNAVASVQGKSVKKVPEKAVAKITQEKSMQKVERNAEANMRGKSMTKVPGKAVAKVVPGKSMTKVPERAVAKVVPGKSITKVPERAVAKVAQGKSMTKAPERQISESSNLAKSNNNKKKTNYNDYEKNNNKTNLNNYSERSQKKKKGRKVILIITIIILLAIVILLVGSTVFGIINNNSDKIIKGVYINKIEVSSLNKVAATESVNNVLNNEENNYITIKHGEYSRTVHLSEIEGKYDVENSVSKAFNLGRESGIIDNNFKTIQIMQSNVNIDTPFSCNMELVSELIDKIALELPDLATESSYIVDNNKIVIKNSKDGVQICSDEFKNGLVEAFSKGKANFEIPVEHVERKEIDIDKIHEEIYKPAKDAYYTTNPRKVYKEENGLDFAITLAQAKQMLAEDKEEYEINLRVLKPKVTVNNLEAKAYPDQLATFTTNYGTSDVGRNTNIALAAKSINSVVVMPGETFSFNNLIGECSTRTGYQESTIYLNGELSKGIGGGICQVSTTLYNAVIRANLEIVQRRNHSLGVTYVPAGQDAMVSIGSQDFQFKNNRSYPVKVVAFVGTGSITCQVYGLKQSTEYEVKLQSKMIEDTSTRYKVQTYKILYLDGKEISRTLISTDTYKKH